MPRTLGAGITAGITQGTAETTELLKLDFADLSNVATPVYLTTAARDLSWNSLTWQAVGGRLEIDALGESADGPADTVRLNLSGVDQTVLALILGARWRGRTASVYYAHLDQAAGTVKTDPVLMFTGLMNGGFDVSESRGDFGGGTVDISCRLTSKMTDLVKVRGVRTNVHAHQATIPGASGDTFFQYVAQLALRKVFWGVKAPGAPHAPIGLPWPPPPGPNAPPGFPSAPPPGPYNGTPSPFGEVAPGGTPATAPPPSIDPGSTTRRPGLGL